MGGSTFLLGAGAVLLLSVVGGLLSSYFLLLVPPPALPLEEVKQLAQHFYLSPPAAAALAWDDEGYVDQPMVGKVVIVTGSTSGIGSSLAYTLYKWGATVVVTSRSQEKCDRTVADFKLDFPFSEGVLHARVLDVSDFQSIHQFCDWVKLTFPEIHILVNNAGINYAMQDMRPSVSTQLRSPQGYDLLFASNYLGHFLLTDLLLPLLRAAGGSDFADGKGGGRILQVSSNSHSLPSGSDLDTGGGRQRPLAAQVLTRQDRHGNSVDQQEQEQEQKRRWQAAYGLSKLAQVMHAVSLQKLLDADPSTSLKIFSFAPGITYTGMVPTHLPSFLQSLLRRLLYSPEAATYAALTALFSPQSKGGDEYWTNTPLLTQSTTIGRWLFSLAKGGHGASLSTSAAAVKILLLLSTLHQQYFYGQLTISPVNPACGDASLTEGLYQWSHAAVHSYVFKNSTQQLRGEQQKGGTDKKSTDKTYTSSLEDVMVELDVDLTAI